MLCVEEGQEYAEVEERQRGRQMSGWTVEEDWLGGVGREENEGKGKAMLGKEERGGEKCRGSIGGMRFFWGEGRQKQKRGRDEKMWGE